MRLAVASLAEISGSDAKEPNEPNCARVADVASLGRQYGPMCFGAQTNQQFYAISPPIGATQPHFPDWAKIPP
jgi:hypothetical protein